MHSIGKRLQSENTDYVEHTVIKHFARVLNLGDLANNLFSLVSSVLEKCYQQLFYSATNVYSRDDSQIRQPKYSKAQTHQHVF